MNKTWSTVLGTGSLLCVGGVALAGETGTMEGRPKSGPQEPIGFVTGAAIGGAAGGPFGVVIGAGIGTWLGNRVHRADEAKKAEAQVAALQAEKDSLEREKLALQTERSELAAANRSLAVQVAQLSHSVEAAQAAKNDPTAALDGLQGDVLFRTGSAEIAADTAHQIEVLAQAVAKSPQLKVRVDGYADPRGTVEANLKLSEERANAVRDLLRASGVSEQSLEVNAYGKNLSVADDPDGYALERRVRLTLQAPSGQVAAAGASPPAAEGADPSGTR
jgi:outer membrane protein OmpA-like peptidoglycan-associated protein